MKNLISFNISLLIFLLCITTDYMIGTVAQEGVHDPVLDTDGDELQVGKRYHVLPIIFPGGGLFLYPINNETCTNAVAQLPLSGNGLPVTFSPANSKKGDVILQFTDLNIIFPTFIGCGNVWKLEYDESVQKEFVVTSGALVNEATSNWFQIEKVGSSSSLNYYKFVFCPKLLMMCRDVGIYNYDGVMRLALGVRNLRSTFVFKKVQTVNIQ